MSTSPTLVLNNQKIEVVHSENKDDTSHSAASHPELSTEHQRRIWRKIDLRLLPILTLMYLCAYLDRASIGKCLYYDSSGALGLREEHGTGNAKIQGLTSQLGLTGSQFNIVLTMYCIPYAICECPANLVLKKLRPSKWLPGITVTWGAILTLTGLVKTYPQLIGARMCLAVAEAGLFAGVVYYMTFWYPRHMLQVRVGIFYGGATLSGAFSGLLAYGISFLSGTAGLLGWSWIFIVEGLVTVVVGGISFFILVDFPATATFLTEEERDFVIWTKKYDNSSVGEEEHFELRHLTAALCDWQIWTHIVLYCAIVVPLNGITYFAPTIINAFGYDAAISQLLTVPPYLCATITLYVWARWSDYIKMRSPFILAGLLVCIVGFAINVSPAPIGVKYLGVFFCVTGPYAAFPGLVAWLGNNLAGQYKRGVGMALQLGIGNLSAVVACNIYLSKDAPRYILGHVVELILSGVGLITLPILVLAYRRINATRALFCSEMEEKGLHYNEEELRRMGDRAPEFQYTL